MARNRIVPALALALLCALGARSVLPVGAAPTATNTLVPVPPSATFTPTRTPTVTGTVPTPTATNTATAGPTSVLLPPLCDTGEQSGGIWLLGTAGTAPEDGWTVEDCERASDGNYCRDFEDGQHWLSTSHHRWNRHYCDADNNGRAAGIQIGPEGIGVYDTRWPYDTIDADGPSTIKVRNISGMIYRCQDSLVPGDCFNYDPRTSTYWTYYSDIDPGGSFPQDTDWSWAVLVESWSPDPTPFASATPVPAGVPWHDWGYPLCGTPHLSFVFDHLAPSYGSEPNAGDTAANGARIILYSGDQVRNGADGRPVVGYDGHDGWDHYLDNRSSGLMMSHVDPEKIVLAVQSGRVIKAGLESLTGGTQYGACSEILEKSNNGSTLVEIRHDENQGSRYLHLSSVLVQPNDAVYKGQPIGIMGQSGSASDEHLHLTAKRYSFPGPYKWAPAFDPYGWDKDYTGMNPQPMDFHTDPWYKLNGIVSERKLLPGPPDPLGCPLQCTNDTITTIDNSDPGFSCGWCNGSIASSGVNGTSDSMYPSGTFDQDGSARWQSSLPPGQYAVSAWIEQPPGLNSLVLAQAARYMLGEKVVQVNQAIGGGRWQLLGVYNYKVAPYVELSNAAFDLGSGWADPDDCSALFVDAVAFQLACNTYPPPPYVLIETPVPKITAPVPTPCAVAPCRTPTPSGGVSDGGG